MVNKNTSRKKRCRREAFQPCDAFASQEHRIVDDQGIAREEASMPVGQRKLGQKSRLPRPTLALPEKAAR